MEDHLVSLTGAWAVWKDFAVRSAGFPVAGLDLFGTADESARLSEVARLPAFGEAVTWQSREALASAVDKLARNERASPARRLRREEIVASYWQRYCAKNDTIGFFGPLAWGSFDESGPAAMVRAGGLVRERVVHLEVWAVEALARAAGVDAVVPMSPYPERDLRTRLGGRPDSPERARALAALDRLEAARDAVADAGRDDLLGALIALDRLFEELTGRAATRQEDDSDGGRTVAYLDCMRDLELTLGSPVLAELRATLPALVAGSRWWCGIAYAAGQERLQRIADAHGPGPLAPMLGELMRSAWTLFEDLTSQAEELQRRWASLLDGGDDATIGERAAAAFDDFGEAWPFAVFYSADLQIAAAGIDAIEQGDFRIVIGDFHGGSNPLMQGIFARRHPDPAAFGAWVSADVGRKVVYVPPRGGFVPMTARMFPFFRGDDYTHIVSGPRDAPPDGVRALNISELNVDDGHVSDRGGSFRLPLAEVLWLPVFISSIRSFDPFGRLGPERVTIGRTVVHRAHWTCPAGELALEPGGVASWARNQGMPRRVFVRSPLERKPIYVDLESPTLLRVLTRFLRPAAEKTPNAPVTFTEMLPEPDDCWLADGAGRYTSEFRVVAVDTSRRAA
jgi:lantibiotic biosynthesis dehydratase-like protein